MSGTCSLAPRPALRPRRPGTYPRGLCPRGCGVRSQDPLCFWEGSTRPVPLNPSAREAEGTQGSPGTSWLGEERYGGTLVSKHPGLQGDVSAEGLPRCNKNFMAPGSASSWSLSQPHARGLQLERWRRQPLGLARGLDLGTLPRGPRQRPRSVGGRRTGC